MPVFALVFPVEVAVAATALVHLANNLFKLALLGRHAHAPTLTRFVLPALPAALLGAWILSRLADAPPLHTWLLAGRACDITPIKLIIAAVIGVFAIFELSPRFDDWQADKKWLPLGGTLSGFFGGLSGHQGALRSAFLLRAGLTKEQFLATGIIAAVAVDVLRLTVYGVSMSAATRDALTRPDARTLVIAGIIAAFAGSFIGARLVRKVTLAAVKRLVGAMLLLLALALGAGVV